MNKASLPQWLQHLEALHPTVMELGLERVSEVAHALDLLPCERPVVTVAGTNGKGSTVAVLGSVLAECGKVVGCFTSPHFLRFNERIRVAGEEVSDAEIVSAFAAIEQARGAVSLTYFEFATLAALLVFRSRAVDVCVLEVGLGGRLDSANIVDATVAVISSIDLDHQEWLGDTRGAIAREKAGIMRRGSPAVIADPAPPEELLDCARAAGAGPVYLLGHEFGFEEDADGWTGYLAAPDGSKEIIAAQGKGSLLPANICGGLQAVRALGVEFDAQQLHRALDNIRGQGRRQLLELQGRRYLLDVAHNPAAIDKLLEYIVLTNCNKRTIALFSAMKDKSVAQMLAPTLDHFDAWFLADQPDNERAMPATDIAQLLRDRGQGVISISKNIRQAFRRAQTVMSEGDTLVVFGSFFTVAGVLPLLDKDRSKHGSC